MGKSHVLQRNDGYNERYQRIEKFHIFISVRFSDCDWIFSTYARIERNKNKCYIKQIYIVAGAMCWCIIEINSSHNSKMFYASAFLHELWDKIMSEPATKQASKQTVHAMYVEWINVAQRMGIKLMLLFASFFFRTFAIFESTNNLRFFHDIIRSIVSLTTCAIWLHIVHCMYTTNAAYLPI